MSTATAERRLPDLAVKIDGRNARNGHCTWPEIRDTIEQALAELRAADGKPADPPSQRLARERNDLEALEQLALVLARRAHDIRVPSTHDNLCDVKLGVAA